MSDSAKATDLPSLPPPADGDVNGSPSSSRFSKPRPTKLKRNHSRQKSQSRSGRTTPTPSVSSTTSSLSEVKNFFSSWVGNIRAGVTGAWTKARGEYDTYLATQDAESRMQRRRIEILGLTESTIPSTIGVTEDPDVIRKRPATSDASTVPLKKRSLNKKLKKQKSLSRLVGKITTPSRQTPTETTVVRSVPAQPPALAKARPPPAPVYRSTAGFMEGGANDDLRSRVQSLETEISSLRAKLRWFEESFGEIPPETLVDIHNSLMEPKKQRRSIFKEELDSVNSHNSLDMTIEIAVGDESILPKEIKSFKGHDGIDVISEEMEGDYTMADIEVVPQSIPPESTIKMIPPSPSVKSPEQSPRPKVAAPQSPLVDDFENSVDLLETLSPIHPNIMPVLAPRASVPNLLQEKFRAKAEGYKHE